MMTTNEIDSLLNDVNVTFVSLCKYKLPSGRTQCFIDLFHKESKRQEEINLESYNHYKVVESVNHDNSIYTKRIK